MKLPLFFLFMFYMVLPFTHGDLDARIKKASEQIENDPKNSILYIKRGELYFQHEEYRKSIVDFETARSLGVTSSELDISLARSYYKVKKHSTALAFIQELLIREPNHVQGNRWKGRILMDLKHYENATEALALALEYSAKKTPEQILELAQTYDLMRTTKTTQQACEVIKEGIKSLGELPVFIAKLVGYFSSIEQHEEALKYQTRLIDISNRKDLPYYNRARLHIRQNHFEQAKADLDAALLEIDNLPTKIKQAATTQGLMREINSLKLSIH